LERTLKESISRRQLNIMSSKIRNILFIAFIGLFVIITPLVMLYAAGYEFNWEAKKIQKTGTLNIITDPKGAKVYLDGKVLTETSLASFINKARPVYTPAKIKNLLPGEYLVKLEAEGYWPWEKKADIYPGEALNLDKIILIKKDLPILAAAEALTGAITSPDRDKFLCLAGDKCGIFSLSGDNFSILPGESCKGKNIVWSRDGSKILIGEKLYDLAAGGPENALDLAKIIPKTARLYSFDSANSAKLYFFDNKSLNLYSYGEAQANPVQKISGSLDDYSVNGNELRMVSRAADKAFLIIYDLSQGKDIRRIELPYSEGYKLKKSNNSLVSLLDEKRNILYIIDPLSRAPSKETIENVKVLYWMDENNLLYANDFEIWKINASSGNKELFTRLSDPIKDVIWHPSGDFIIYSTANSLNLLETSGSERKVIELVKLDQVSAPALDKNGEIIYFYGAIREKKGIYKLRIR